MSLDAFVARAVALSGRVVPDNHTRKGAVGEAVERWLGVGPSNDIDVPALELELKTLPCRHDNVFAPAVTESTWVASATPASLHGETWSTSRVHRKLARVLFVPYDVGRRVLGRAFLWHPNDDEKRVLRSDWEDLADLVAQGHGEHVTARRGVALQLRPKAKNRAQTAPLHHLGDDERIAPMGFYLRRGFVQSVLERCCR
jgi:DNA mismatch repair protein MutH